MYFYILYNVCVGYMLLSITALLYSAVGLLLSNFMNSQFVIREHQEGV
jgi:hypothetical protein